jgi:hypothetical protein
MLPESRFPAVEAPQPTAVTGDGQAWGLTDITSRAANVTTRAGKSGGAVSGDSGPGLTTPAVRRRKGNAATATCAGGVTPAPRALRLQDTATEDAAADAATGFPAAPSAIAGVCKQARAARRSGAIDAAAIVMARSAAGTDAAGGGDAFDGAGAAGVAQRYAAAEASVGRRGAAPLASAAAALSEAAATAQKLVRDAAGSRRQPHHHQQQYGLLQWRRRAWLLPAVALGSGLAAALAWRALGRSRGGEGNLDVRGAYAWWVSAWRQQLLLQQHARAGGGNSSSSSKPGLVASLRAAWGLTRKLLEPLRLLLLPSGANAASALPAPPGASAVAAASAGSARAQADAAFVHRVGASAPLAST